MRFVTTATLILAVVLAATASGQENNRRVDNVHGNLRIMPLHRQLIKFVKRHYPDANSHLFKQNVQFEYSTRPYIVEEITQTQVGQKTPLIVARGPMAGGVWCDIEYNHGPRPASYDRLVGSYNREYFTEHVFVPSSEEQQCFLVVRLRVPLKPTEAEKKFVAEFTDFISNFGEYIPGPQTILKEEVAPSVIRALGPEFRGLRAD